MIRAFLSFSTLVYAFAAFGVVLLIVFALAGGELPAVFVWARNTALVLILVVVGIFGFSHYNAPWRMLWRRFPVLNQWVFPDLNGLWLGETRSNWSKIDAMRKAAAADETISDSELEAIALQSGAIAFQIKAHWFGIKIKTKTEAVNGNAVANDVTPSRGIRGRDFELAYIYDQNTPQPVATDEGNHIGAATLEAKVGDELALEGEYWTRRSWAQGLNTAGLLKLTRVTDHHVSAIADLLDEAKKIDGQR